MRDIGDVYTNFKESAVQYPEGNRIIKIFGVFRVDCESEHVAKVPALLNLFIGNLFIYFF